MSKKIAVIGLLLMLSCKSKQINTRIKETVKIDTIFKFKDRVIDRPVIDSIIIEEPCDSLGNLKPFKQVLRTNHAKVSVEAKNGKITAYMNIDSLKTVWEKEHMSSTDKQTEIKEKIVVKYRCSLWLWIWAILASLGCGHLLLKK